MLLRSWSDQDTWNTLGTGVQADGTEAVAAADATLSASGLGAYDLDVTASLRAWAAAPASNRGWALLATTGDGITLSTAEGAAPPKLTVNFYPPGGPPVPAADAKATTEDATLTSWLDPARGIVLRSSLRARYELTTSGSTDEAATHSKGAFNQDVELLES